MSAARGRRVRRAVSGNAVWVPALLVLAVLATPVIYTAVFSFNDYTRSNLVWNPEGSPTTKHWLNSCGAPGACEALGASLHVGVVSTLLATLLGTLLALALVRARLRARGVLDVLLMLPMATPDVVLGAGLLTLFVQGLSALGVRLGEGTIIAAHVMLALSFVVVAVRARLESVDERLLEASQDLYAGQWASFRHVLLPLIAPGVAGAALLAFAISMDDVVVATFTGGEAVTFPRYVYITALRGIPAQANVIGIGLALAGLALAVAWLLFGALRTRARQVSLTSASRG